MPRAKKVVQRAAETIETQPVKKIIEDPTPEQIENVRKANEDRNQSRLDRMNEIADSNDSGDRAQELEDFDGDKVIVKDDAEEREARAQHESAEAERALAEAQAKGLQEEGAAEIVADEKTEDAVGDHKVIDGVPYYLQIINGQERWMSLSEIRAAASKVESADQYLKIAAENARNAATGPAPSSDEPVKLSKDEFRKTLSAVALGDEGAIDTLASALERLSAPDDPQQIDRRVSFLTELASARAEQREVMEHPFLGEVFSARLNKLKTEAPQTPLTQAFRKVGTEIRKAFPEQFQKSSAVSLTDKAARKRTLPAPVVSAGRQAAEADEEEDESVEQTIAKMANARGQAQPVLHGRGFTTNFAKQPPER
jgi:hypothetical protein